MHVLFLAPDTSVYNHHFVRALKDVGARVSAIGPAPKAALPQTLQPLLDDYQEARDILDGSELVTLAERMTRSAAFDRVETIDEPLVEPAAMVRERIQLPGLSVANARLCRDKVAMKEFLRARGIPCAQSGRATSQAEVHAFAEAHGYPLILKPIAGFGSLNTHRVDDRSALDALLPKLDLRPDQPFAIEEFIDGHEGFFDTITDAQGVRHEFAAHYYPGCLEASVRRDVAPQIAVTNRIEQDGYRDLRELARNVIDALSLRHTATHMEWFRGSKGLKFSEIGARPAGEKIWDMYRFANEFDVFVEWALATLGRAQQQRPTRRYAAGSVQIRPDRDGVFAAHHGLEVAWQRCREWIYEYEIPALGSPTKPLDKGWLCNTWFRLRHPDYDQLRDQMTFLGRTVRSTAR